MIHLKPFLKTWVPLAVVTVLLHGTIYVTVQQTYRQGANDPQIQISEDSARYFADVTELPPSSEDDLSASLATFVIVYDKDGKVLAATGKLDGAVPVPPMGVLEYAKQHGQDRITWQPKPGVRFATVITSTGGENPKLILAGRSLREVEARIGILTKHLGISLIITLIISALATALCNLNLKLKKAEPLPPPPAPPHIPTSV